MSWKPEVQVEGTSWSQNALVFATEQEASDNARDLMMRWYAVKDCRAAQSDQTVNYSYVNRQLVEVKS